MRTRTKDYADTPPAPSTANPPAPPGSATSQAAGLGAAGSTLPARRRRAPSPDQTAQPAAQRRRVGSPAPEQAAPTFAMHRRIAELRYGSAPRQAPAPRSHPTREASASPAPAAIAPRPAADPPSRFRAASLSLMDQAVDVSHAARRSADWSGEEQRIDEGRRVPARLADALGEIHHVSGDADFAIRVWRIDPADQPALRRAADEVARAGGPRPAGDDDDVTVPGTRPPAFVPGPRETRA